tara:strand:+ start:92 stop:241 length:150 start_codon:yes stop_codon:yes gene_type:complete
MMMFLITLSLLEAVVVVEEIMLAVAVVLVAIALVGIVRHLAVEDQVKLD